MTSQIAMSRILNINIECSFDIFSFTLKVDGKSSVIDDFIDTLVAAYFFDHLVA